MNRVKKATVLTVLFAILSFALLHTDQVYAKEFKDVPKNHANYTAIQEMERAGFISGYPDGKFRPNEPVSRKHVAVLLDKALNFKRPLTDKLVFKDVPKKHPYYTPIMKLYNEGIVSGANGKFNPESSVTRVQLAKMLDTAFNLKIKGTYSYNDVDLYHWGIAHIDALSSNGISNGDDGNFHLNRAVTRAHYAEFLSRAMKVGKSEANPVKMTEADAKNLFFRLPILIDHAIITSKNEKKKFSQARLKLLPYATERFTNGLLKQEYPYQCAMCDAFIFPYVSFELYVRFDFEQPNQNELKIHTILVNSPGAVMGGGFVDYMYKRENGKWKMHDLKFTNPGKRNFELTLEEAKLIAEENYGDVRYLSQTQMTAIDPLTYERYTYTQYSFSVWSYAFHGDVLTVNSDDGKFEFNNDEYYNDF